MVASVWLRGTLQVSNKIGSSRFFCQFTRNGKSLSKLQSSTCLGSRLPNVRSCFHLGATNIARNVIKNSVGEKWKSKPNIQSRLIGVNGQVSIYIIEMDFGEKHVKQPRRSDKFLKVADNTGNTVWPSARPFFLYLSETNRDLLFKRSSSKDKVGFRTLLECLY